MSNEEIISKIQNLLTQLPSGSSSATQKRIIYINECSKIIGKSKSYIRNEVRKNPKLFPPLLKTGECTRLQWRYSDVIAWLDGLPVQRRAKRKTAVAAQAVAS